MPEHREADTRLLLSIALLQLPEGDGGAVPRRPVAERLRERLGPALHDRLVGARATPLPQDTERPPQA